MDEEFTFQDAAGTWLCALTSTEFSYAQGLLLLLKRAPFRHILQTYHEDNPLNLSILSLIKCAAFEGDFDALHAVWKLCFAKYKAKHGLIHRIAIDYITRSFVAVSLALSALLQPPYAQKITFVTLTMNKLFFPATSNQAHPPPEILEILNF